jgi:hypothetical protein
MWGEHIWDFGEPVAGSLSLGQVIDELVADDPELDDELFDRCAQRTWHYVDHDMVREVAELVRGVLTVRGWRRRPSRLDDDYSSFSYDLDTVPPGAFDARVLVPLVGEMAFRMYPGKHAFFEPESEPAQARAAAELVETEWLWSTVADLCGYPSLDGRLLRERAASWVGDWDELFDHVARLQQT